LPQILYQIQTKFRDEPRPRFGVIRSKEFLMKDAYSFDKDKAGLDASYEKMFQAYQAIFKRCGLDAIPVEADTGMMGGEVSHEFMVVAPAGEDQIVVCTKCPYRANKEVHDKRHPGAACPRCQASVEMQHAIEVGHVFKLGTKYSDALGARFQDEGGQVKPMIMGCYGIGVNRIVAAAIEQHHDDFGIMWPPAIAPYLAVIIPAQIQSEPVRRAAEELYQRLTAAGMDVVLDDRDERAGVKFHDADLVGFPYRLTVSDKSLAQQSAELKPRAAKTPQLIPLHAAAQALS
jgi:prolyl-tRNA synthetase